MSHCVWPQLSEHGTDTASSQPFRRRVQVAYAHSHSTCAGLDQHGDAGLIRTTLQGTERKPKPSANPTAQGCPNQTPALPLVQLLKAVRILRIHSDAAARLQLALSRRFSHT